jgi:hypothetical protein
VQFTHHVAAEKIGEQRVAGSTRKIHGDETVVRGLDPAVR